MKVSVIGYYIPPGKLYASKISRLREDFPEFFPKGNMNAKVQDKTEGKDINVPEGS